MNDPLVLSGDEVDEDDEDIGIVIENEGKGQDLILSD
jgi:hypothetical protein